MTYAELQAAIADELDRTDIAPAIRRFIASAEAHLSRVLDLPQMEVYAELPTASGQVRLPSDFRRLLNIEVASDDLTLRFVPRSHLDDAPATQGASSVYTLQGDFILLHPAPEDGTVVSMRYRSALPKLSDDAPENWFATRYHDALFYAALVYSAPHLVEDARIAIWAGLRDRAVADANTEAVLSRQPFALRMTLPDAPGI